MSTTKKKKKSSGLTSLASNNPINITIARKVLKVVDAGLTDGEDDGTFDEKTGRPVPGHMCVEAAVSYAFGEPHTDRPKCVSPEVRAFKISLNDHSGWKGNMDRARGLRNIAIAQLGSKNVDKNGEFLNAVRHILVSRELPDIVNSIAASGYVERAILDAIKQHMVDGKIDAIEDLATEAASHYQIFERVTDLFDSIDTCDGDSAVSSVLAHVRKTMSCDECAEYTSAQLKRAAAIGIEALRRIGCPGVPIMDRLVKEGVLASK